MKEAKAKDTSSAAALAVLEEKARCTRFTFRNLTPIGPSKEYRCLAGAIKTVEHHAIWHSSPLKCPGGA